MGQGEAASCQEVEFASGKPHVLLPTILTEGVWAEVKVGREHLRLFAEHNAQGVQVSVYNVNAKSWIAPSEAVEGIEEGKEKAEEYAKAYLKSAADLELPTLIWKKSRTR